MVIWKEQFVLGHGPKRWAIITITFHDEMEPVLFDSSFKVEPLTPHFRLTAFDKWNLSKHAAWKRQGWRTAPDGKRYKTAFPHEADE